METNKNTKEISRILEIMKIEKPLIYESITGDVGEAISSFLTKRKNAILRDFQITETGFSRVINAIEKNEIHTLPPDYQKKLAKYILTYDENLAKSIYESSIYNWLKSNPSFGYIDFITSIKNIKNRSGKSIEEVLESGNVGGKPILVDKSGNPDYFGIQALKGKIEKEVLNLEKNQKFEFEVTGPPKKGKWEKLGDWADKKVGGNPYGEAAVEGFFRSRSGTIASAKALRNLIFFWKKSFQKLTKEEIEIALKWYGTGIADWPNARRIFNKLGFLPWLTNISTQMFRKWIVVTTALSFIGFMREIVEGWGSENEYLGFTEGALQKLRDGFTAASLKTVNPTLKTFEAATKLGLEPAVRNQGRLKKAWLEYFNFKEEDLKRKKEQLENGKDVDLGSEVESEIDKLPKNKNKGKTKKHNFTKW